MVQKIIVAEGIGARGIQADDLNNFLKKKALEVKESVWTYPKGARSKARFEVHIVYTLAEFTQALDTEGAYVVYELHSRYGQGPAFENPSAPASGSGSSTNPWGLHFRMGYDAINVPCENEILYYSVHPQEYDLLSTPTNAFLPQVLKDAATKAKEIEARRKAGKLTKAELDNPCDVEGAWRSLDKCAPDLAGKKSSRGEWPLKGRHYFAKTATDYYTAVKVGSADLEKSSLKCKVLFMSCCWSHQLYLAALDRRRKAVKSNCEFYLLDETVMASSGKNFVSAVFSGVDPTSAAGKKRMVRMLNSDKESGRVRAY
jgi:hypothetical protein